MMRFLSWLFSRSPKNRWRPGGTVEVVGESRYQKTLSAYCGGRTENGHDVKCHAILVPEDDNEFDENAVRVEIVRYPVGYLCREYAILYRETLKELGLEGEPIACAAKIVGGWDRGDGDRGHFGVKLALAWPPRLARD